MDFKKRVSGSWVNANHYTYNTSTDTLTLPAVIYGDGTNAAISLKGNGEHTGTLSPDNNGTGEMTGNLVEVSNSNCIIYSTYNQFTITDDIVNITGNSLFGFIVKCSPNTQYTVSSTRIGYNVDMRIREYSDLPSDWTTDFITQSVNQPTSAGNSAIFTTTATTTYLLVCFYGSNIARISKIMLNLGLTALPYEPHGIKIPISIGSTTTNIYIGENPLRKSLDGTAYDTLDADGTLTQRVDSDGSVLVTPVVTQITMPTFTLADGANTVSVDTTVQPSEITMTYHGWHPVAAAHERSNSQWD